MRCLSSFGVLCRVSFVAVVIAFCLAAEAAEPGSPYAVIDFGATGDGTTKDTGSVQRAIDACAEAGGGTVYFAPGVYVCGSLHLRSRVTLHLDNGATILGSPDISDYDPYEELGFENDADRETSFFHHSLIWGEDVEHVAIVGQGTIDSNWKSRHGPKAVAFKRCRFVEIRGVLIQNAPNYSISLLGTDFVTIDGVTILNGFADGIDPDSCRNVRIANCHIESWDDAIVPKASFSLGERRSVENITITNCYLTTGCNAFKLGTESGGDFKRIAVTNCVMEGMRDRRPASSGIALESVDGSNIDGIVVSNITMVRVRAPIFIRLGNRGRDMETPAAGTLRNVSINNILATEASLTCTVSGIPGHNVEGISISDVRINFVGGCPYRPIDEPVPENVDAYPDPEIFGALPSYGFYCRHVDGLTLRNVQLAAKDSFWRQTYDERGKTQWPGDDGVPQPSAPGRLGCAIVCEDVRRVRIDGLRATPDTEGAALVSFTNVQNALIQGAFPEEGTKTFLEVAGEDSDEIHVVASVLDHAESAVIVCKGARPEAVQWAGPHE